MKQREANWKCETCGKDGGPDNGHVLLEGEAMKCRHPSASIVWLKRVTGRRPRPIYAECICGERVSLGPSNDRIPRRERLLAGWIADVVTLWEPGHARDQWISAFIESASEWP